MGSPSTEGSSPSAVSAVPSYVFDSGVGAVTVIAAFVTVSVPFAVVMSKFAVTSAPSFVTLQEAISQSLLPASV